MAENTIKVSSTNIQIFPTTGRPTYDPVGRLTTEYNLTSILNRLLNVKGFVITECENEGNLNFDSNKVFEFNIYGYLIHIEDITEIITEITKKFSLLETGGKIIAYINITEKSGNQDNKTSNQDYSHQKVNFIQGADEKSTQGNIEGFYYTGVNFDYIGPNATPPSPSPYTLTILEKTEKGWTIPIESKIRLKTDNNHKSISIDDGVLGVLEDNGVLG